MQRVTWATFLRSKRSAVWKISSSGTPYFLIAAWNLGKSKTDWVGLGTASDFDYMIATIAATHMSLSTLSYHEHRRHCALSIKLQAGVPPT